MQELLKNAWQGWLMFTSEGKYPVLLMAVLLYFWFRKEGCREWRLLVYTTAMMVCCICPVTAAILMKYQTSFYNYVGIWNYVPLTLMTAYGAVVLITQQWTGFAERAEAGRCRLAKGAFLTAVILLMGLCGRMGKPIEGLEKEQRQDVRAVLEALEQSEEDAQICLWAPRELMEAARGIRADICLVYGRNMWEAALGAYSYEVYGKEAELLYLWMDNLEESGNLIYTQENGETTDFDDCIKTAKALGVNRILLPDIPSVEEMLDGLRAVGQTGGQLENYYLLEL